MKIPRSLLALTGIALAVLASSNLAAATKYVTTTGSDSHDGDSRATAYLTITKGLQNIGAGGRLYIGGGLYKETLIDVIPSGLADSARTIVTNYGSEVVTVQPNPGAARVVEFIGNRSYITLGGNAPGQFILEAANTGYNVVKFSSTGSSGAGDWPSYVRLQNMELKNSPDSGVLGFSHHCEFVGLVIHHNGDTVYDHGMYIEGADNVIDGCDIYANYARGIQIFMSGKTGDTQFASRNTVRNCRVHENGVVDQKPGIDADSGTGNLIYNNLIYGNGQYGVLIQMGGGENGVYNNTFYGNGTAALCIKSSAETGNTARNNLAWSNGSGSQYVDERGDVLVYNNLWDGTDPKFTSIDPTSVSFLQLSAQSTGAIDRGATSAAIAALVTSDFWGDQRPQGTAYDIGADEYVAPPAGPVLRINQQPQSQYVTPGTTVTLNVAAEGTAPLAYQWEKDGAVIAGATGDHFVVASATATDMGLYTVTVTSGTATMTSACAIITVNVTGVSRLINLSTRGTIRAGETLTPGFVMRGSGSKKLVVRAVGPGLVPFGVPDVLADPRMNIIPLGSSTAVVANDDWGTTMDLSALKMACDGVGAFALPAGSKDAAVATTLPTTQGYTVEIAGNTTTAAGVALAEIYDADALTSGAQLINVSALGYVGVDGLTPGFVIRGDRPKLLLIRAVGPTLATTFGVGGVLEDPQLTIVPLGKTLTVASNNDWGDNSQASALRTAFGQAGAFGLVDGSRDSAVVIRLPPGAYTATASGVGGTTGRALIEVYDLD